MKTILDVKVNMLKSNMEEFKQILEEFNINEFDDNGDNILHYYIYHANDLQIKYNSIIDLLVNKGIDINQKQNKGLFKGSPLQIAISQDLRNITDYLIELGANINSTDANGNNILSTAISRFNFGENGGYFIKKLIDLGADIKQENNHGVSPKTLILRYNNGEGVRKYISDKFLE